MPAHIIEQANAQAKKQKLDDKLIESLKNEAVLCYDGQPLTELQMGIMRDVDPQPLISWTPLEYCIKEANGAFKYPKVLNNKDTEWVHSQPASNNARNKNSRMGKLSCNVQLGDNDEGKLALVFLKYYYELVIDAIINGMKLPDGTVFFAPKKGDLYSKMPYDVAKDLLRKNICSPLNEPTKINPNTGQPYLPQAKFKVRWFYDPDKSPLLTTPLIVVEPPVMDPNDPSKKIASPAVDDPICYLAQPVKGAWIVTFDNVNFNGTGGQTWMSMKLDKAMLQVVQPRSNSVSATDFYD
jgi:hypothetical protein